MAPQEQRYEHGSPKPREYEGDRRADLEDAADIDIATDHQGSSHGWFGPAMRDLERMAEADAEGDRYAEEQAQRLRQDAQLRGAPPMPGTYYRGYYHDELKQMVDTNLEPGQVGEAGAAWNDFGNAMVELDTALNNAAASSETDWQGAAGDGARGFLSGLGGWVAGTGEAAYLAANQLNVQAESAATARNAMPEPVEFSVSDALERLAQAKSAVAVATAMTEIEQKFTEKNEAHERAAQVMTTYAGDLGSAGGTMPAFAAPPTMDATQPPAPPSDGDGDGQPGHRRGSVPVPTGTPGPPPPVRPPDSRQPAGRPQSPASGPDGSPVPGDGQTSGQGLRPGSPPPSGVGAPLSGGGPRQEVSGGDGRGMVPFGALPFGPVGVGEQGRGVGGPGSGRGFGPGGPPARGGAPGGPGPGARPPGGLAAEHAAPGRAGAAVGAAGGRGAGPGAGPMGAAGSRREEDTEHQRPEWLIEPDPEGTFGTEELTAPPVIGVDDCPNEQ